MSLRKKAIVKNNAPFRFSGVILSYCVLKDRAL